MTHELRDHGHAARSDAPAHFSKGPEGEVGEAPGGVFFGADEPDGTDDAHDAADDGEEGGGEDDGDAPFLALGHLQVPDADDGDDEEDEVCGGADGG